MYRKFLIDAYKSPVEITVVYQRLTYNLCMPTLFSEYFSSQWFRNINLPK